MMADGVEGAARSLPDPTPGRIESVVHQVVMDRLNDGQFDECDITLRQIRLVEDSLVKSLCSIYHGRVAYPKTQKAEGAPKDSEDEEDRRMRREARSIAG
jgi:membrane-associated HD superfamily phosphohydrolase